jgi:arsenate reductase (glutaredoxin)
LAGASIPILARRDDGASRQPGGSRTMKKIRIYEYSKCSTCRNALRFLDINNVAYEKVPIVETPPTKAELKRMLAAQNGDLKKLFNTSGELYREMKIGAKLGSMTQDQALDLLATNGKLVKRPFVLTGDTGLVGFKEDEWKKLF